jgi:hypothetical protein
MKKLGIAALLAAGVLGVGAPSAMAGGPDLGDGPCATVSEMFETANVHVDPLPEPLGSVAGTAVQRVCRVAG